MKALIFLLMSVLVGCAELTSEERLALMYGAQMMNNSSLYYFGQAQENARANAWNNTFMYTMKRN